MYVCMYLICAVDFAIGRTSSKSLQSKGAQSQGNYKEQEK